MQHHGDGNMPIPDPKDNFFIIFSMPENDIHNALKTRLHAAYSNFTAIYIAFTHKKKAQL